MRVMMSHTLAHKRSQQQHSTVHRKHALSAPTRDATNYWFSGALNDRHATETHGATI
jgi:hypothetical protein